jgi:two-component system, NarL family, sensor kinase
MKNFISILFLLALGFCIQAQTTMNKDSLLRLIKTKKDTALVHLYINIGQQYEGNKIDSAKYFYKAAGNLSDKIGYKKGKLKFFSNYTYILNVESKFEESIKLNQEAVKIALQTKDDKYLGCAYGNLGSSYQYDNKLDLALSNYLLAEKYLSKINYNMGIMYSNIGNLYSDLDQFEKALIYSDKAIEDAKKTKSKNDLAVSLLNKSMPLLELKRFNEAEKVLQESLLLSKEVQNNFARAAALLNMGDLKIKTHKYEEIKKYADEALDLHQQMNNPEGIIIAQKALGIYYLHQKNYNKANLYTKESLKLAKEYESLENQQKAYSLLSEIALAQQNISQSYDYRWTADSIETIVNLDEVRNKIEEVKGKYEADKKALQIKTLTQKNDIKDLKIKRRLWTTIALLFALLGLGGFAYSQYKNFKSRKALLVAQQETSIVEERLRIATDMHDDVGSGLSRIRYIVSAVLNGQTEQNLGLSKVTEISDDAVQKMKEIIWSLNESNQNLENLIYYIRGQMSEMLENANVNFVCHLPDNIPTVFFGWKRNRNTYLLVKEAINNALKHAEAKTITLDFIIANDLKITISDDGKGFDTNKNFTGNGLNNYKKRIADLNANYELKSEIGVGTTFSFHLPLTV